MLSSLLSSLLSKDQFGTRGGQLDWEPTKRRPALIKQHAELSALVDRHGILHRLKYRLEFMTNVSKQPLPEGGFDENSVIQGFDFLPSEPAVFSWQVRIHRCTCTGAHA